MTARRELAEDTDTFLLFCSKVRQYEVMQQINSCRKRKEKASVVSGSNINPLQRKECVQKGGGRSGTAHSLKNTWSIICFLGEPSALNVTWCIQHKLHLQTQIRCLIKIQMYSHVDSNSSISSQKTQRTRRTGGSDL